MIKKVVVIGAGTMGVGIAQWFAQKNVQVFLLDNSTEVLKKSHQNILASWDRLLEKGKFSGEEIIKFQSNLVLHENIKNIPEDSDLVIEAIIEEIHTKKNLFKELDSHFNKQTIFASNTSGLSIQDIFSEVSNRNCLGLHFFNPATIMKLVEIIPHGDDELNSNKIYQWFHENGKVPVIAKDSPGFICNRVARNFYGEALRLSDHFAYSHIDQIMRRVGGFRMGPFELMDLIGIDINLAATKSLYEAYKSCPRFFPHPKQVRMVESGNLGKKTGKGFLSSEEQGTPLTTFTPDTNKSATDLFHIINSLEDSLDQGKKVIGELDPLIETSDVNAFISSKFSKNNAIELINIDLSINEIQQLSNEMNVEIIVLPEGSKTFVLPPILSMIIVEAILLQKEGVASKEDIDLAMKYGLNYPHGPFNWLEHVGYDLVKSTLKNQSEKNREEVSRYPWDEL